MDASLIEITKNKLKELYKTEPLMIFSPGRINLIGEHTDYNDGFAFPAAINKGIYLAISKSDTNDSEIYALDKNGYYQFNTDNIKPLENGGWRNYILGVVAELQIIGHKIGDFSAVFAGDIPGGAGLSSSAALENAFAFGLNELFQLGISKHELIKISQKAENHYAGVQCGIMDQYASMFGVEGSALLLDCRTIKSTIYKLEIPNFEIVLINSNVKHDLKESAYNDRRSVCEAMATKLKVPALRDASIEELNGIQHLISREDYRKARYVIEENLRVLEFSNAITQGNIELLGELMYQSHHGLSNQFKVSCDELDFLVDEAKKNGNVVGARMMGGGFGGCTINIVKVSQSEAFKKDISIKFRERFGKDCLIYQVKLSQGTHLIQKLD